MIVTDEFVNSLLVMESIFDLKLAPEFCDILFYSFEVNLFCVQLYMLQLKT